jgi:hypothetical protein
MGDECGGEPLVSFKPLKLLLLLPPPPSVGNDVRERLRAAFRYAMVFGPAASANIGATSDVGVLGVEVEVDSAGDDVLLSEMRGFRAGLLEYMSL